MPGNGSRPTRRIRIAGLSLAIFAVAVLLGAAPPPAHLPGTVLQLVGDSGQGAGSTSPSVVVLLLLVGLGLVVVVALAAAFVLFRTRGAKAVPPSAEGWWTCSKCGAGNMDGAARCHACATWRTSTPQPTASPTP